MARFLKKRQNALLLAGLLFAQLVLLSLQVPIGDAPSLFERTAFAILAPVQRAVQAVFRGLGDLWSGYVDLRHVAERNQTLQEEVYRLRQENALLREAFGRFAEREASAAFLGSLKRSFILASVVGLDVANPYKSIVIDRGSAAGIEPNMPVLDSLGHVVGRVVPPLGRGEATVQLITDDGSAVSVLTEGSRVLGILSGDGKSGRCWMKYVAATNDAVQESEILVTSGFDKIFPPELRVGRILSVGTDTSLFKRIGVAPFFDFPELRVVAVLTGRRAGGED